MIENEIVSRIPINDYMELTRINSIEKIYVNPKYVMKFETSTRFSGSVIYFTTGHHACVRETIEQITAKIKR
jgi:uncharacterized protein YlzI (FlbEa/FlbD family)